MMLHPATVHFAMVLPIVALGFGIAYMISRNEGMSKISSRVTLLAALAMIVVWYTGNQAGPQIYEYLSESGKTILIQHKTLGLYLAISMSIIAIIKIIGCRIKKYYIEAIAIVLLFTLTGATLFQGKMGGEIVYNHGMPFKAFIIEDSLDTALADAEKEDEDDVKVEIYEDAIDDIKMLSEEIDTIYTKKRTTEEE